MSITELSVKKPIAIIMVVVLFMGLGIFGYSKLGADLFPSVDTPYISVITTYPGAGAEEIEKDVVKPIEDTLSGLSGIDVIRSGSAEGYGFVILQFTMSTKVDNAFMDVQQALGDISSKLPKDASKPVLKKYNKNSEPVMMLSISGGSSYEELYNEAEKLKEKLQKISGVAGANLVGDAKKEVVIQADKSALEYYGINITTITGKLQYDNMDIPAGEIKKDTKNQTVRVQGEFQNLDEIRNTQIPLPAGGLILLSDVAGVSMEYPDLSAKVRSNGQNSIGITIQKQSDANIVETTDAVKKEIEALKKNLPEKVSVNIASDSSKFINSTLKEIKSNLVEGILTTSLVMFLFLRQVRASLIVLVAIPTSLIATFFMMNVFGFTLNLLSLLALSVSIGILVDDSIVVLENIQRHLRQGKGLIEAAIDGRKEIAMAAISITLCDVVVFGPIAFMSDMIGKFFREFGLTVVFATLFSLAVSFTVTPMLASRLLKREKEIEEEKKEVMHGKRTGILFKATEKYKSFLIWALDNRLKVISLITILLIGSVSLIPLKVITTEFLPTSDQSKFDINIGLAPGVNVNQTDEKTRQVEEYLKGIPEVSDYFATVGTDKQYNSSIHVNLVDKNKRNKSQSQLVKETREWGKKLTGVDLSVDEGSLVGKTSADGSKPVIINITGSSKDVLKQIADKIEGIVKTVPGTTDISNSTRTSASEISVKVDRLAANQYGIKPLDLAGVINAASVSGSKAGVYRKDGNEYDIKVKFKDNQVASPEDINNLKITAATGQQISINQVANVYISDSPMETQRLNRQNKVNISANIQGRTLGSINADIKEKLKGLNIPNGYNIELGGEQSNMATSFSSLIKALIVSILLVYMILTVLYESFFTPLLRMLSLPCGAIGAFLAIAVTGKSLNLVTMIGLIMLDGLASKNGTLLIDYTNILMKRGLSLRDALIESGATRLRPIIMTSVTMIVGMLPSALALGEGSEIKSGMSIALVGGLVTSTILSPILIPVAYTLLEDIRAYFRKNQKINADLATEGN